MSNPEEFQIERPEIIIPGYDPEWYEHLEPVDELWKLKPAMFGVVDTEETKYGWAMNHPLYPHNLLVQQRAAEGLLEFTHSKDSMKGLWNVYRSLFQDGDMRGSRPYEFRAPYAAWQIDKHLRDYAEKGDIQSAAKYTAAALFSPWPR